MDLCCEFGSHFYNICFVSIILSSLTRSAKILPVNFIGLDVHAFCNSRRSAQVHCSLMVVAWGQVVQQNRTKIHW